MSRVADACPNAKRHTKHPEGYFAHAEWAEKKMRTHVQTRCPECGLWTIWTPKKKAAKATCEDPQPTSGKDS